MDKLAIVILGYRCYTSEKLSGKPMTNVLYGLICDASIAAYAAVVYRCIGPDSAYFVAPKTWVSPLNHQIVPRLSCHLVSYLLG